MQRPSINLSVGTINTDGLINLKQRLIYLAESNQSPSKLLTGDLSLPPIKSNGSRNLTAYPDCRIKAFENVINSALELNNKIR